MNKNWILGLPVLASARAAAFEEQLQTSQGAHAGPCPLPTVPKNGQFGIITEPLGSGRPCWETLDPANDIPPVAVTSCRRKS